MAELLCNVYETYAQPLTHEMLWDWHAKLFSHGKSQIDQGQYRVHSDPMQIVGYRQGRQRIFFEAPPSDRVFHEMGLFLKWFNSLEETVSLLGKAAIAHVYFESIHPFEDGNGRIGRLLIEKILAQGVKQPTLMAVSKILEKRKKEYYAALERCNKTLEVDAWVKFFADAVVQAQEESTRLLYFLIEKARILEALSGQLNPRQEKILLKLFAVGWEGFSGGLSADKYLSMTKASRATVTRDLADLVEKGVLIKTGKLRHTRYWLNIASFSSLEKK